jgi:Peptidase family M1 domain
MPWIRLLIAVALAATATNLSFAQSDPFDPFGLPRDQEFSKAIEAGTRSAKGEPGPKFWTNTAAYDIEVEIIPDEALVRGKAKLTYTNRSPRALRRLQVHLRQNLHLPGAQRTRTVETTGGFEIDAVTRDGEAMRRGRRGYRVRGTVMTVQLPERLASGESTSFEISWHFTVPRAGRAPRMGHENKKVFYLGYWYPQFAVYDDVSGWVAEQYLGNGEFYMGYADYRLAVTVPAGWIVRATGELENAAEVLSERSQERLRTAMESRDIVKVIARDEIGDGLATKADANGKSTWIFRAEQVRDVAISTSNQYAWDATHAVVKDRDGEGKDGKCRIEAVYEPGTGAWNRAAEFARHTIEWMSREVYPYPWPHMTACEGIIGGGMEYPMMTLCGSGGRARGLQGLIAHELVHMWFPMIVGQNEKWDAWMDEGTTSFYEGLIEAEFWKSEDMTAAESRADVTKRTIRGMARRLARNPGAPCVGHADFTPRGAFVAAAYGKPSAVLHQLRNLLGDEIFFGALRNYVAKWAYKHPRRQDFFAAFETAAGRDLGWYFRAWHHEVWTFDQAVALRREGDEVIATVKNLQSAVMPTTLVLTLESGETETLEIPVDYWLQGNREWSQKVNTKTAKARIDPERLWLDSDRDNDEASL